MLRKAFWLDFQIKCTRTPWLSSFKVQESFFPASRMQTATISGRNLLTKLSEAISIVSYISGRRGDNAIRLAPLAPAEHVPTPGVAPGAENVTDRYIHTLAQIRPLHCRISCLALRRSAISMKTFTTSCNITGISPVHLQQTEVIAMSIPWHPVIRNVV